MAATPYAGKGGRKTLSIGRRSGQSLWLSHLTRDLLDSGSLKRAIEEWEVTGVTFHPAAFGRAVKYGKAYDAAIRRKLREDIVGEALLSSLTMEDMQHAADLLRSVHDRTDGVDGWVSMMVSPLVLHDRAAAIAAAKELYSRSQRPNVMVEIPGTRIGLLAVEEAIFTGVPVNVTLLMSRGQYQMAAGAYLKGIERRIAAGLLPAIASVASIHIDPWEAATAEFGPAETGRRRIGAVTRDTYAAWREMMHSPRWERAYNAGARPQRLLWSRREISGSGGTEASWMDAPAIPFTVITLAVHQLEASAERGGVGTVWTDDRGDAGPVPAHADLWGVDTEALAAKRQSLAVESLTESWFRLLSEIAGKSASLHSIPEAKGVGKNGGRL